MRADWSSGQKLAYAAICLVGTALAMWALGVWFVRPMQDWLRVAASDWPPEATFGIVFGLGPILWFLAYRYSRKTGSV